MPRSKDILTLKPIIKLPANETAAERRYEKYDEKE